MLLSDVCLSVAYIGPNSRTERPRKTEICTEVAHVSLDSDTTFKVRRSKVNVTRPLCSPPCWRVRLLQRWAWERGGRGKQLLRCRLLGNNNNNNNIGVAFSGVSHAHVGWCANFYSFRPFTSVTPCDWEVQPWSVTATARRSALAGCSSAGAVQTGGDGPPLSGTASPVVPRRLLRAGLHGSWSPAPAIRQSPSTHRSTRPSQHFRRSCFRHCGPNSLEFSAWQFAWSSCWAWSVSTWLENASVWVTLRLV